MPAENLHYRPLYITNAHIACDSSEPKVWVAMRSRKEKVAPAGIAPAGKAPAGATFAGNANGTGADIFAADASDGPDGPNGSNANGIPPQSRANGRRATARSNKAYGYEIAQNIVPAFFMPMKERVISRGGRQQRTVSPAIPDIFFVKDTLSHLNTIVNAGLGIEYLYVKGQPYRQPVVIRDSEMENFIAAATSSQRVTFHTAADDNLSHLIGRRVRITADGTPIEGELLTVRGSRTRRLRVSLPASLTTLTAYIDLTLPPGALIESLD